MSLYIDSAFPQAVERAFALRLVSGVTTNPALMARSELPVDETLRALLAVSEGTVFHQLAAGTVAERRAEAERVLTLDPERVGLKIPCTLENLTLATELAEHGACVGITAIFSPAQVALACQAGARYVLPYVNRATRLLGDGLALVSEMRAVIEACGAPTRILAASLKSPEEAADTLVAGAHDLTLPLPVLRDMAAHPLSDAAIVDFAKASS